MSDDYDSDNHDPGERQRGDASMFRKPLWPKVFLGIVIVAVLVAVAILAIGRARAQQLPPDEPTIGDCHPYAEVATTLKREYGEKGTGQTLVDQTKTAVEVFIGPVGSMTVVEVFADLTTCYRVFNTQQVQQGLGWGTKPKPKGAAL